MTCHCGTEFEPKRSHQVYCSRACRVKRGTRMLVEKRRERAGRKLRHIHCARWGCERRFKTYGERLYCSERCRWRSTKRTERACRAARKRIAARSAA